MNKLSDYIKAKRSELNLSLREFTDLTNISHSYISQLETGIDSRSSKEIKPTIDLLEKIAFGLNITLFELMSQVGYFSASQIIISFSQRLKETRESKNLTQLQLASIFGLSQQTIDHYEKGYAKPSIDTLCKFADYFDCSTDYLLGRNI